MEYVLQRISVAFEIFCSLWEVYGLVQLWVQHYSLWPGQIINFPLQKMDCSNATEICCTFCFFPLPLLMDLPTLQNQCRDLHLAQLQGRKPLSLLLVALTVDLHHDGAQGWKITVTHNKARKKTHTHEQQSSLHALKLKRQRNSLKHEGLPPEEDVVHDLAAGLSVEDAIQVDLAEVLLL